MHCWQQMQDFTLTTYKKLLQELLANGYSFQTLQDFIQEPENKTVILRHDVDRKPGNALIIAAIEKEAGIKASYYFRIVKQSYDEDIIRQIAEMGHEIGYHYENLSEINCLAQRRKGAKKDKRTGNRIEGRENRKKELFELAIEDFGRNLEKMRKLYPVKTICMHGSPLSKWDNRDLWKRYDYRDFGIIAEPYFDVDFDEVFYLTDTGRAWNNENVSIRDKVASQFKYKINSSADIMNLIQSENAPDKIMMNVHPHRWFDFGLNWCWEFVSQNLKNIIKYIIVNKSK